MSVFANIGRSSWRVELLGRIAPRHKQIGQPHLEPLSVFLDVGVVPRREREGNYNQLGENLDRYLVVQLGDIVFNRLRTWQGGLGVSKYSGIVSPAYIVCRPKPSVEPQFLHYTLRSQPYLAELTRLSKLMPPSQFDILWDDLRRVPIALPEKIQQRAISDFLDAETARIDSLITKKRQMLQLLIERSAGIVEREVRELVKRHGEQRLKTAVRDITVGIVVTPSVWYADQGIPAIRGLNVRPYKIDFSDIVRLSPEGHRIHVKSKLHAGDVIVVRTGQAGAAAVVPPELDDTNCIDLLIVRPGYLDARFLVYVLNSDWTRKHIGKHSVGTIQSHFNVSSLAELPIPVPPLDEQRQFVLNIVTQLARLGTARAKLRDQLELLQERRQALITAAVTGEMDVPGVPA